MEGQQRAENARKGLAIRQNLWDSGVDSHKNGSNVKKIVVF